jgi:transposase
VPRVECGEHGVLAAKVPWSEPGSRFTALFEALVIDWLKEVDLRGAGGCSASAGARWTA